MKGRGGLEGIWLRCYFGGTLGFPGGIQGTGDKERRGLTHSAWVGKKVQKGSRERRAWLEKRTRWRAGVRLEQVKLDGLLLSSSDFLLFFYFPVAFILGESETAV
jgi:hypothetical protein